MNALKRIWRKAPTPLKLGIRATRYQLLRLIVGEKTTVKIDSHSFTVVHGNIDEYRSAKRFLKFEPEFLAMFKDSVADAKVVYDIGGYIGMYSLTAVCCNPRVSVYCFEPQHVNYDSITRNASANRYQSIHVFRTALGDAETHAPFVRSGQTGRIASTEACAEKESTSLTTLDNLVQREKLPPPDTIKIDVEGYEAHVLRGMRTILRQHRPVVLAEIHPRFMEEFGESAEDVDSFMADFGYKKLVLRQPKMGRSPSHSQTHVAYLPAERN